MCATPVKPVATDVTTADQTDGDATTALYRGAIGPVNTAYYLPIFTHFESQDGGGMRWNWAAALCTLNWFAYRKLWGAALAYVGIIVACALLVFGIGRLVFQFSEVAELAWIFGLAALAFAVPGLFGNALFYAQSRKRMAHALTATATLDEACAMLVRGSSSRIRLGWLGAANVAIVGAISSGYAVFPPMGGLHRPVEKPVESRAVVVGKTIDIDMAINAATTASSPAMAASSAPAPAAAASAPAVAASAPAPIASAPAAPVLLASAPATPASKPKLEEIIPNPPAKAIAPEKAPAKTPVKQTVKPPVNPAAKETKKSAANESFYLNVGLFADDNNARNVHVKLTDAGLASMQLETNTPKGKLTRVRVGPFDNLTEADKAAKKIRALGLEAVLVRP